MVQMSSPWGVGYHSPLPKSLYTAFAGGIDHNIRYLLNIAYE